MRKRIQSIGRALSGMVMPNIGAFIAWGFLTAIFLYPNGWFPNEEIAKIQPYMLNFLLPILIAGQGGQMIAGIRGRVIASIAIVGCIAWDYNLFEVTSSLVATQTAFVEAGNLSEITASVDTTCPMLMAAMIIGPFSGWVIKKFDQLMEGHMPAGFEMLINNFSIGIFGMIIAIIGYFAIGPFLEFLLTILASGVDWLITMKALPAVAVFLEPAKVLFLNNAINHGIFTPLGALDVQETGKSIMYMLETNPGPGLGVLLAYWVFSKDKAAKQSAPGAVIIHALGGIHEIYFPYVLAKPSVIIAPICGNLCAITWFMLMSAGLSGPASPGSIITFLMMSPKDSVWVSAVGILIATAISFLIASPIIKRSKTDIESAKAKKEAMKKESSGNKGSDISKSFDKVSKIIFACDAGMGSSAMGATKFAKRIKDIRPDISCSNSAIDSIPQDADIVVCQSVLADRVMSNLPSGAQLIQLENFLGDPALDMLFEQLSCRDNNSDNQGSKIQNTKDKNTSKVKMFKKGIKLGQKALNKDEAIQAAGELLKSMGCVDDKYILSMHEREKEVSTYLGMGVAIPHGTSEAKANVKKSGIVFLQYPDGVSFGEEKAYLVFGIAGVGNDHLDLLAKISDRLEDEKIVEKLKSTNDPDFVKGLFNY